jgi:hypothetical protein
MYGLINLLKQLTSILKHQQTPSSIKSSILSFCYKLLFEEITLVIKLSDSSSSQSTTPPNITLSYSFYPYLIPIIEYAEKLKVEFSESSDVIASAISLLELTKISQSKKVKEESVFFF